MLKNLTTLFCRHRSCELIVREIEVNQKKNKPPDRFTEGIEVCEDCARALRYAYLPYLKQETILKPNPRSPRGQGDGP